MRISSVPRKSKQGTQLPDTSQSQAGDYNVNGSNVSRETTPSTRVPTKTAVANTPDRGSSVTAAMSTGWER